MRHSEPTLERDRIARRSGAVFVLSVGAAGLALFAGFGFAMAACANSVGDVFAGFGNIGTFDTVKPIPIPQTACPYVRLASAAAADAAAPWHDAFAPSPDWNRFSKQLSAPLANLDAALAAAVPHVPDPVARDLRTVLRDVQFGRVQLLASTSVNDYMVTSKVLEGFTALGHASALIGTACGPTLAPPLPF
ncbi:MAG: hypothetical protein QOE62_170 [Actinomycetota bacterium]|nr:hypothetical protein [Actinomycetota bacterium]